MVDQCEPQCRGQLVRQQSQIVCPLCAQPQDGSPPLMSCFGLADIARCRVDVIQRFLTVGKEIVAVQTYDAQQAVFDQTISALRVELAVLSGSVEQAVQQHRLHVLENILNLRCPRQGCGTVFADFTNCFAVTCRQCNCGFCGW